MTPLEECVKEYLDNPDIADEVDLLRRIPPNEIHFDTNLGRFRPKSWNFSDDADGRPMSVARSDIVEQQGRSLESVLDGHEGYALAAITAGEVRAEGQTVHYQPQENEQAHTVVYGPKSKGVRRRLARQARWIVLPDNLSV